MNIEKLFTLLMAPVCLLIGCTHAPNRPVSLQELPACGSFPNCVNTQSGTGVHASEPISASSVQWQSLKSWVEQQKNWEIMINEDYFMQAVVKTPIMRFRDDVQLLFMPDLQLIHVRSSSRLGYSYLGLMGRGLMFYVGWLGSRTYLNALVALSRSGVD